MTWRKGEAAVSVEGAAEDIAVNEATVDVKEALHRTGHTLLTRRAADAPEVHKDGRREGHLRTGRTLRLVTLCNDNHHTGYKRRKFTSHGLTSYWNGQTKDGPTGKFGPNCGTSWQAGYEDRHMG